MMPIRTLLAVVASALAPTFLASCEETAIEVAGGSAVEGETVTARILDGDGGPAPAVAIHAFVDVPSSWTLDLVTDSSGRISIRVPATATVLYLQVASSGPDGQILTFRIPLHPSLDTTLSTRRWGALSGSVTPPPGWNPRAVEITGLGLNSTIDGTDFALGKVPPGTWPLVLQADSAGWLDTFDLGDVTMPAEGDDVRAALTIRRRPAISFEFDDSASTPPSTCRLGGEDFSTSSCAPLVTMATGSSAWSGTSLRLHLPGTPDQAAVARLHPYADSSPTGSVAPTDKLVWMARGTGLVQIAVGTTSGDSILVSSPVEILLQPVWTRHEIRLSDLLPATAGGVALSWISIGAHEDSWVVLDDIRLVSAP